MQIATFKAAAKWPTAAPSRTRSWQPGSTCRPRSSSFPTAACWWWNSQARSRYCRRPIPRPTPRHSCSSPTSARRGPSATGNLRHRARSQFHHQSLLLHLLYRGNAECRSPLALHGQCDADGQVAGSELVLYRIRRMPTPSTTAARSISATTGRSTSRPASNSRARPSQDLTSPRGKILRFNPDGTVPTDNPFYDGAGPNYDADLGARAAQPLPRLLRRADRSAAHRRRRRQQSVDGDRGSGHRRAGRQLRLAERRRAERQSRLYDPDLLLSHTP